ncbi:TPA: hypothetical protein ACGZ99_003558 [Elizabethkingia anophelis]
MKKLLLLLILLFFSHTFSQNKREKEIDSLFRTIQDAIPYYIKNDPNERLKVAKDVYAQSKEVGYTAGQIKALLFMAALYNNTGNTELSIEKSNEGISLSRENEKYIVSYNKFLIVKGRSLSKLGYFTESRNVLQKALAITSKIPDNEKDAKHYNKAFAYYAIQASYEKDITHAISKESQKNYLLNAYKEAVQISDKYNPQTKKFILSIILQGLVTLYTDWNELDKAKEYLKKAESLNASENSTWSINRNVLYGEIEKAEKKYSKAIEYYNTALALSKEYNRIDNMSKIYSGLAESYHGIQDYQKESQYLYKYKRYNDSLDIVEKGSVGNILKNEIIEDKNIKTPFFKSAAIWYITGVLLLILLSYYIIKRIISTRESFKITGEIPDEQIDIYEQIPNLPSDIDHEKLSQAIKMAQKDDPAFYFKFMEVFPNFHQNLLKVSRKLSQSDLEFCAMMKLNFDTKEIAAIKRISAGAVESKKHRIRKKLGLDTDDNIYIWLIER